MLGLGNTLVGGTVPSRLTNNYSLLFDGNNEAVQIDNITGILDEQEGTYSAWIKASDTDPMDSSRTVMIAQNDSNNFIRLWWYHSESQFSITYKRGGNASRADANTTDSVLSDDTWHHLVATWDTQAASGNG